MMLELFDFDEFKQDLRDAGATNPTVGVKLLQSRERITVAEVQVDFLAGVSIVGTGGAVCDQIDTPNAELGARLALGRALCDVGKQLKSGAWKEACR